MRYVLGASVGVAIGGPLGGLVGALLPLVWAVTTRSRVTEPPISLVLLLLLIELRSGRSVLASLISASDSLPNYVNLRTVSRVARVSGLMSALPYSNESLRPVLAQLARAQRSGASLGGSVRRMLDTHLASERARKLARARTLPTRLMIPVTLLMLPGLVLAMYAPSLLATFRDLTGALI